MKQPRIPRETAHEVAALFDQEEPDLLSYATVLNGRDEETAKDLVQQTFMAAAVAWDKVGPRSADGRRAWLRVTCRNKWIDQIRRARKLQTLQSHLERRYARTEPDPADIVLTREALARCWSVVRSLPPVRRQVAVLAWLEGYTTADIAVLLAIQPSGVRKHLSIARDIIQREVGPYLDAPLADVDADPQEVAGA